MTAAWVAAPPVASARLRRNGRDLGDRPYGRRSRRRRQRAGPSTDRAATGLPLVEGTGHIVATMQRNGMRRYVGNGAPSVLDPRERPTWQTRLSTFDDSCYVGAARAISN